MIAMVLGARFSFYGANIGTTLRNGILDIPKPTMEQLDAI
jgi:hypothetical protein